jgi:hypothetical protein
LPQRKESGMSVTLFYKNKCHTISFPWIDAIWQEEDIHECGYLYLRLRELGFQEIAAEQWTRAFMFKKLYTGLVYSEEAENKMAVLKKTLQSVSR